MSQFTSIEKKLIAVLVVAHLAITVPLAATLSIGNDEAYSLETSGQGPGHAITRAIGFEMQPPLYFAALNMWRQVFGDSLLTARLLSIACTVSALGVLAAVSQRYLPRIHSPRLVAVAALHPFFIWAAIETRLYAMMLLISALQLLTLYEGFLSGTDHCSQQEELKRCRWRVAYLVLGVAGLYTHYYSGFLLAVGGGVLVLQSRWRSAVVYLLGMGFVALCFVPMTFVLAGQLTGHTSGAAPASFSTAIRTVLWHGESFLLPVSFTVTKTQHVISQWVWRVLLLAIPALTLWKFREATFWRQNATILALVSGMAASLVVVVLLTGTEMFAQRHAVTLFIPALLASFMLVATLGGNRAVGWWSCAMCCFGANALLVNYAPLSKGGDFARVGQYLHEHRQADEPVAVFLPCVALALKHHFAESDQLVALPCPEECVTFDMQDWKLTSPQAIEDSLAKNSRRSDVVWLVRSGVRVHMGVDLRWDVLDQWIADGFEVEETVQFNGSEVLRLRRG